MILKRELNIFLRWLEFSCYFVAQRWLRFGRSVHDLGHVTAVILHSVNGRATWKKFVLHSENANQPEQVLCG